MIISSVIIWTTLWEYYHLTDDTGGSYNSFEITQLTLLAATPNQPYLGSQCPVLFLSWHLWPFEFHPCQTHMWSTILFCPPPNPTIILVHHAQWLPWELGVSQGQGLHNPRQIILSALYPLIITEVHSSLWYYLSRSSSRRPGCLPWNSSEEMVFSLVIALCLPVLSPPLVKHWIV